MAELFLDPAIRFWVFLPLVIITFLFGVIRHYMTILFASEKKSDLENVGDIFQAFHMRKFFFNDKDGFFKKQKRENTAVNPITDPSMASEMMKSNALNMVPMIVIGTWINWAFSGFLTTKVPFPLTYRFKPMLQRGCESLVALDASCVYGLVLGSDNSADQPIMLMPDHAPPAAQPPQDIQKAFKAEWEALEVVEHKWALADCEMQLICRCCK